MINSNLTAGAAELHPPPLSAVLGAFGRDEIAQNHIHALGYVDTAADLAKPYLLIGLYGRHVESSYARRATPQ